MREAALTQSLDKCTQLHTVLFSHQVVSNSLWVGLQQARLPYLLEFAQILSTESVMPSNHLVLCRHLLPSSIFPSIMIFSNDSGLCIRQPKYWSFSFSISPSNEYSGLTSLRIDWFDLCYPRESQQSSPASQFESINSLVLSLWEVQLPNPYMTTGKATALTRWIFASKVMSLLFNALTSFATVFLLRSKRLLISWLQSPSAVILEPKKRKSATVSMFSPSICHEVMGPDVILVFWMLNLKPVFSLSSFTFIKRIFSSSSFSAIG